MRLPFVSVVVSLVLSSLLLGGCTPSAPAAGPSPSPAQPKAAEPTKVPEVAKAQTAGPAQPTAAPAKKVDYPAKGRSISFIVPFPPGGGTDVCARALAESMEKELGAPVNIVNKAGAGSQVGVTELAQSKPDGYTIGIMTLPVVPLLYMNPERNASFGRKDFQPVANYVADVGVIAVSGNSPYKSVAELVEAAKANPAKVKVGTTGLLGAHHVAILQLEKLAGVKFAMVHFEGSAPALTALIGGHIDAMGGFGADLLAQARSGEVRIAGVMDKEESKFAPGAKTLESQGYKMYFSGVRLVAAPAGTPREVVDILAGAIKRSLEHEDHKKRLDDLGVVPRYMGPDELAAYWADVDAQVKPLLEEAMKTK